jgi:hypothetical protein
MTERAQEHKALSQKALRNIVDNVVAALVNGAAVSEVWEAVATGAEQASFGWMAQSARAAADASEEVKP